MIVNIIQRPELTETYELQRQICIDLNLMITLSMRAVNLDNLELVEKVKKDSEKYGYEVMLWLDDDEVLFTWLMSIEEKKAYVKKTFDKFKERFGYMPKTVGHYILGSDYIKIIKDYCPEVSMVIAGCFEEGVRVFHGCNNSWYLFSEGMSWTAWYPSKTHSVRPACDEEDWSGVVAVPHLSRDLVQAYEGRDDFFASHPANVQRGLGNEGAIHVYDYNLIDQYRMQEDYNNVKSNYHIHVASGWLSNCSNLIDSDEITQSIYRETLEYIAELCKKGEAECMTMNEYCKYYRRTVPIGSQTAAVAKDIIYDSGKHYFWLMSNGYRVLVDAFQGGSIGDLRPYAGKYEAFTGLDAEKPLINSYPFIIQSQLRSGVKHHYGDGSRTTLLVTHGGETLDMCFYPTKVSDVKRTEKTTIVKLTPVTMKFKDGYEIKIQTVYDFGENDIGIERHILEKSEGECELCEYLKGSYGFTEYPEEMRGITLGVDDKSEKYLYKKQSVRVENGKCTYAEIPQITTRVELCAEESDWAEADDGELFIPYYTLKLNKKINETGVMKSWLKLKKI